MSVVVFRASVCKNWFRVAVRSARVHRYLGWVAIGHPEVVKRRVRMYGGLVHPHFFFGQKDLERSLRRETAWLLLDP